MSKLKSAKKGVEKVIHSTPLRIWIGAGVAQPGPPLGPQLGQRGINIAQFCKDFNERTKDVKPGTPLPCTISVKADRSYDIQIRVPPISYFIRQATGQARLAMDQSQETAGILSLKHVYEIAQVKSKDPLYDCVPLKKICEEIIEEAFHCGVKVVDRIDEHKYMDFMKQRHEIVAKQLKELEDLKQSKLLRTA
ncbi:mitochondrial ribosomal protein L11 [Dermatophagoides farinae]|uniref:mitochondrial ribosomal protein L11 n=1 Tax=Dermatophagoides farinae TaxID=6954 RepID=UPI003F60104E